MGGTYQAGMVFLLDFVFHWPTTLTLLWIILQLLGYASPRLCVAVDANVFEYVCGACLFETLIRFTRLAAVLMHEFAHVVAAGVVVLSQPRLRQQFAGKDFLAEVFRAVDVVASARLESPNNEGMFKWLARQVFPGAFAPAVRVALSRDAAIVMQDSGPCMEFFVRQAGLIVSILAPLLVPIPCDSSWIDWAVFLGVILGAVGAVLSDWVGGPLSGCPQPLGCFCCGNWGLLVPRDALGPGRKSSLFPSICSDLLTNILEIVELRGAQAGGCNMFLSENGKIVSVCSRVVKSKRGRLTEMLFKKLHRDLSWRSFTAPLRFKRLKGLPIICAQGHTRFGTSSAPAIIETHPHRWLGPHKETVWRFDLNTQRWRRHAVEVCITVTHNGDFDGWRIYDQVVPNDELGEWLSRVFHYRNPAKGDSPKLAGVLELLACQGQWFASVRLAFALTVLGHEDECCWWERLNRDAPNAIPAPDIFTAWARMFESVFAQFVQACPDFRPTPQAVEELAEGVSAHMEDLYRRSQKSKKFGASFYGKSVRGLSSADEKAIGVLIQRMPTSAILSKFCDKVCKAFFENDLLSVVWYFFSRAEGTFGISVTSTLNPEQVVLAGKGQPISVGFDIKRPVAYWASEPASLDTPWPSKSEFKRAAQARWDLHDADGEAVELRIVQGGTAGDHINTLRSGLIGTLRSHCAYFVAPGADLDSERPYHILIRGTSLDAHNPIPMRQGLFKRGWIKFRGPLPKRAVGTRHGLDPVAADLRDVPAILKDIDESWSDRASLNRKSADKFSKCLGYLIERRSGTGTNIDVLILGVENSLWLGQQFGADLARVFPKLNVKAMSSNWVLGLLQEAHGHITPKNWALSERRFTFSDHAIVLVVSQSGTTYPTVWATRLLSRQPRPLHIFAMSSGYDSVLANSLGLDLNQQKFSNSLFTTFSGVRPCEPSTVASMAMHHTLTQLLFCCISTVLLEGHVRARVDRTTDCRLGNSKTKTLDHEIPLPDCELQIGDAQDLQRLALTLVPAAVEICGATTRGRQVTSAIREDLLGMGKYLANTLTECYFTRYVTAFYLYLTITLGFPLFYSVWIRFIATNVGLDPDTATDTLDSEASLLFLAFSFLAQHMDAHFYVFLAAMITTAHRLFHGRRLWTRHGNRTIVIVDSTANYKILRAYLSKLRALAYQVTTFGVAGQNGVDHFVHEMTHLATSEVILAVGRPDGRLASLAADEAACMMSVQQARFVASSHSSGVEAISVGHNPWVKPGIFKRCVSLPTASRPEFLSSRLLQTGAGPHPPGEVATKVAALAYEGPDVNSKQRIAQDYPWVQFCELLRRMGCQQVWEKVSHEQAAELISAIVREQAEVLGIRAEEFDAESILQNFAKNHNMESVCVGTTKSESSWGAQSVSPKSPKSPKFNPKRAIVGAFDGQFTASQIMTMLRCPEMQTQVVELRKKLAARHLLIDFLKSFVNRPDEHCLNATFQIWFECVASRILRKRAAAKANTTKKERRAQRLSRMLSRSCLGNTHNMQVHELPGADWRTQEELRRFARRNHGLMRGLNLEACLEIWKAAAIEGRASRPVKRDVRFSTHSSNQMPISGGLISKVKGKQLLAELSLVETLYETRLAAAERLLAFFVIFHRAVRPTSQLPGVTFDMDRSESRLRVASTPAPVPFVEELPPLPEYMSAAMKIQRKFRSQRHPEEGEDVDDEHIEEEDVEAIHQKPTAVSFESSKEDADSDGSTVGDQHPGDDGFAKLLDKMPNAPE